LPIRNCACNARDNSVPDKPAGTGPAVTTAAGRVTNGSGKAGTGGIVTASAFDGDADTGGGTGRGGGMLDYPFPAGTTTLATMTCTASSNVGVQATIGGAPSDRT
jgi:hypothetical protein